MASGFGDPTYDTAASAEHAGVAGTLDSAQEVLDPNDPSLSSEELNVNTEGDAYAMPAPPPDGHYRAKLKILQQDDAQKAKVDFIPKKHDRQGLYLASAVEARIIDPSGKYDGIAVYDRWVATFLGRDGSTKVSTILARLRQPDGRPWVTPGAKLSHRGWMDLLVKALAGEPEIGIETQWGWSCQACGEDADKRGVKRPREILGMHKFPVDQKQSKPGATVYSPEMRCQVSPAHGFSRAQVRIASFLSLEALAKIPHR